MPRLDVRHLAVLAWAAVNAGLLMVIGNHLDWGGRLRLDVPEAQIRPADPVDVALLGEYTLPPLDKHYGQTLKRPLFVPTRRPPPPPPPPPKPTMKKGQFQFMGAIILPEASYAMLRESAGGKTRRVEKGQTVNGMLVQTVELERVVLSQYDDIEVLIMKVQPSPKVPTLPAVQAAKAMDAAGLEADRRSTVQPSRPVARDEGATERPRPARPSAGGEQTPPRFLRPKLPRHAP